MAPPNHLVPGLISVRDPFPMLRIRGARDDDPRRWKLLFFHPRYGEPFYDFQPREGPPTWMDPSLFAAMAEEDARVRSILDKGRCGTRTVEELAEALHEVFSERYLEFVFTAFAEAAPYLAEWLLVRKTQLEEAEEGTGAIMAEQAKRRRQTDKAAVPDIKEESDGDQDGEIRTAGVERDRGGGE